MKYCILEFEDFKRVFNFSINYHLSNKSLADRTNGNPRGLGAIMDAFSRGKLIEIGIEKILYTINPNKQYILDFEIHEANNEPDIIKIKENNILRDVGCFIEIKSLSNNDDWIGIKGEQFDSIEKYADSKKISLNNIFLVYATLNTIEENRNNDITGMFLKNIEDLNKSKIFQKYAGLNATITIDFIISFEELRKYGRLFRNNIECIYDNKILIEVKRSSIYKNNNLKDNFYYNNNTIHNMLTLNINYGDEITKQDLSKFKILNYDSNIQYNIIKKVNNKSKKYFIECLSNINLFNDVFGYFELKKDKIYSLDINTKGRHPFLKNNNYFLSRKRVVELINENKIVNTDTKLLTIVNNI